MTAKSSLTELRTQVTDQIKPNTNRETTSQRIQNGIVDAFDTLNQLPGKQELPTFQVTIEKDYLTLGSLPKLGFWDQSTDPYKTLYGELIHEINPDNREHMPNVIVISLDSSTATDDIFDCLNLVEPVAITATAHGLNGELYIGADGEITDAAPDTFRVVHVGSVIDANTLLLRPANATHQPRPAAETIYARGYTPMPMTEITSITVADNGADVEIWDRDVLAEDAPTSTDLINAMFDPDDRSGVHFGYQSTGITITLENSSYVSDLDLRLGAYRDWVWELSGSDAPPRRKCDVKVYAASSDTSPLATINVWDRDVDGSLLEPKARLIQRVPINATIRKIELVWSAAPSSKATARSNGNIHGIQIYGQPTEIPIQIAPLQPRVSSQFPRFELPNRNKIFAYASVVDPTWTARVGAYRKIQEVYPSQMYGYYRTYNPSQGNEVTFDPHDYRTLREFVDGRYAGVGTYDAEAGMISIDIEADEVQLLRTDDSTLRATKLKRWADLLEHFRKLLPGTMIGIYTNPRRAFTEMEHITWADEQVWFDDQYQLELVHNNPVVQAVDILMPTIYQAGQSWRKWVTTLEFQVDVAHKLGKLCVPHWSYLDYSTNTPVANFRDYLEEIWDKADGIAMWDSQSHFQDPANWLDTWRDDFAAEMRSFVNDHFPATHADTGAVNTVAELPAATTLTVPATRLVTNDPTPANNGEHILLGPVGQKGVSWKAPE